ncbi:MAG: DUF465 domain-containing protein [Rickettsiales bacterium]
MSIQSHIESLSEKHAQIKEQITEEMNHPSPDFGVITELKKQKLLIKEEMQRCIDMGEKVSA